MKKAIALFLSVFCLFGIAVSYSASEDLSSAETLVARVPDMAYFSDGVITFDKLESSGFLTTPSTVLVDVLLDSGYLKQAIPPESNDIANDSALERLSADTVKTVFESLFGVGSSSKLKNNIVGRTGVLQYLSASSEYVYCRRMGGEDAACALRKTVLSSETVGDTVMVKVRFGICSVSDSGTNPSKIFADVKFWAGKGESSCMAMIPQEKNRDFQNGDYDEYLPVYTHTFKSNGDGSYYWYSTEMTEGPKVIPENMVHSYPDVQIGTATDLPNPATNVGETTTPATDTPAPSDSSIPTDGAAEEASFPWVWVCIGGAVVIVALGAILLLKKKK